MLMSLCLRHSEMLFIRILPYITTLHLNLGVTIKMYDLYQCKQLPLKLLGYQCEWLPLNLGVSNVNRPFMANIQVFVKTKMDMDCV